MKKSYKILSCLSLAVVLTACNGSTITKEEAKTRVDEIVSYQAKNNTDLYKDGINFTSNTKFNNGNVSKLEVQYKSGDNYLYYKSYAKTTTDNSSKETTEEGYMGMIDDKYYSLDVVKKTYTEMNKIAFDIAYAAAATLRLAQFYSFGSPVSLAAVISTESEGSQYTYKSKGEGHIYVNIVTEKDDSKENDTYIFDNNRFVSYEESLSGDKGGKATLKASYNVSPRKLSLSGYTKA